MKFTKEFILTTGHPDAWAKETFGLQGSLSSNLKSELLGRPFKNGLQNISKLIPASSYLSPHSSPPLRVNETCLVWFIFGLSSTEVT